MSDENELLEPLATEAGQEAIVRAIRDISSLEYAVRAEQAASQASAKAGEASQSASEASEAEDKAKDWATKTDGYVEQETITIPPEQEGEEPTTETINLYSARYYAALVQDIYNNMSFDSVPTENSTNMVNSGTVYSALDLKADKSTTYTKTETDNLINTRLAELVASAPAALDTLQELATALGNDPNFATTIATQLGNKADKSDTYTKTEVDTALSNVQGQLTFDNVPTANSDNPVKSSGIKTALDGKQDTLTFDSTPTANSTNPVTSGGIYTALQNVDANIEVDDEITEDSDNPVTSAAIYEALQNFTPSGGVSGAGNASGFIRDLLYENSEGLSSGTITLNKSWKDYDFIEMDYNESGWSVTLPAYYEVNKIKSEGYISAYAYKDGNNLKYFDLITVSNSDTQFTVGGRNGFLCRRIYGIKFSKNLSEQMYSNVLYENESGGSSGTLTLNDSYKNYDFLEFRYSLPNEKIATISNIVSCNEVVVGEKVHFAGYTNRFMILTIDSETQFSYSNRQDYVLFKIIGHKLAKGGYSGIVSDARMTVKSGTLTTTSAVADNGQSSYTISFDHPMPDTNYSAIVEVLGGASGASKVYHLIENKTVNGFDLVIFGRGGQLASGLQLNWIAIRPNSYTREGMVEDVLFSNASGVNSGTINLSGNISDYDLISIQCVNKLNNNQSSNMRPYGMFSSTQLLENMQNNNTIGIWGAVRNGLSDTLKFSISGDNSITIDSQASVNLAVTKITGIKFGRYVSGVAVDTTVTQNSNAVITSGAVYDALQNIPSGGGSGGSITIDSVPTENSQNAVSSGGVYDALQNLPSGGGSVDVYDLKTPVINGYNIKSANSAYYVAEKGKLICPPNVYTHTDIPSLYAVYKNGNYYMTPILICPIQDGATLSRNSDGSGIDYNNNTYKQYYDPDREITWYCATDANMLYGWNEVLNSATTNNIPMLEDCTNWLSACKKLIQLAEPVIETRTVKENLFSPTNFTLSSGDTISSDTLKALIAYPRPIVVNNETYYFVKKENGTSYYENPNNTIEVSSSWIVTITAKSSGGSSVTVDTEITETSQNPVVSQAIYNALRRVSNGERFPYDDNFESMIPSDMIARYANSVLYTQNGRTYYKKNDGVAAGCISVIARHTKVMLVSYSPDSVIEYCSYNVERLSTATSIIVDGKTYYYATAPAPWETDTRDVQNSGVRIIGETFENEQSAALYIINNLLEKPSPNRTLAEYKITDAYTKTEVDTLLQNAGGSSITVDSTITQGGTNPVEGGAIYTALGDKADKSTTYTKTEVDTAVASKGDVTTDTNQNITGTKTFVGSKKVGFKQSSANDKLGFTLYGNTGTERGYLEFNPTNTIDGVAGLMTLGNYATSAGALTHVGFRRYSNISGASGAYNLLTPLIADAKSPFSLTTTYQNFYLPLGFTDGTTTVRTAKTGVVDLSPLLASLEARIAALEGN